VICAHGARGGSPAAAAHAAAIAERDLFAEVRACCIEGRPGLAETLADLRAKTNLKDVRLVPFLMGAGHTARRVLPRIVAEAAGEGLTIRPPVGTHAGLAAIVADLAVAARRARDWTPAQCALLLVAHGTPRHPGSAESARAHSRAIAAGGTFAEVAVAFLDQAPAPAEAVARVAAPHLVAVGLFADHGVHGEDDVPRLLRAARANAVYAGPVGPAPAIADLIVEQAGATYAVSQAQAASR